jgi:hypothetical protein
MLSVANKPFLLGVIILNVFVLNGITLNDITLSVTMLNDIMLNVVAPVIHACESKNEPYFR